jgi:hypothetical protein
VQEALVAIRPILAVMPPPIRYVHSGDVAIAYQVVGEGPHDLLMIPGWISHLALDWEEPTWVRWCERMTSFARLVRFDKRGTGLSDRPPGVATLEERMEDARAVLDAVGLERAHVMGWSEGGPLAVLLSVAHPERVGASSSTERSRVFRSRAITRGARSWQTRTRSQPRSRRPGAIRSGRPG